MHKSSQWTTEPSQLRKTLVNWQRSVYIYSCYKMHLPSKLQHLNSLGLLTALLAFSALISIFSLPKIITGKSMTDAALLYKLPDYILLILELSFFILYEKNYQVKRFLLKVLFCPPTIIGFWMFQVLTFENCQNWSFGIFLHINLRLHEQFSLRT